MGKEHLGIAAACASSCLGGASVVATTVTLNPVVSMLLGNVLLGEPVPARLAVGLAAVAGGIVLVSRDGNAGLGTAVEAFTAWCVRRRDRRILRGLDERTLLDTGLLKCAPADRRQAYRQAVLVAAYRGLNDNAGVETGPCPPQIGR